MVKTESMTAAEQPAPIEDVERRCLYELPRDPERRNLMFNLLAGEYVKETGSSVGGLIVITNYRLYLQTLKGHHHIPLGLIDIAEVKELFFLHIACKDLRTYKCTFQNNEDCIEWSNRILNAAEPPKQLNQLFAFFHCFHSKILNAQDAARRLGNQKKYVFDKEMFESELERLQFGGDCWRITKLNEERKMCPTYPQYILVPGCIHDKQVEQSAKFRSSRRLPAPVWRHKKNGAIIARSSQPEVGWLGWRSDEDEDLLKGILAACNFDRYRMTKGDKSDKSDKSVKSDTSDAGDQGDRNNKNDKNDINGKIKQCAMCVPLEPCDECDKSDKSDKESNLSQSPEMSNFEEIKKIMFGTIQDDRKLLIIDARSYTTAVANRARGGGYESVDYYLTCEIQFMNLANIHSIRKSFQALRQICALTDPPNWYGLLDNTRWLSHIAGLIKSAVTVVNAVEVEERPVLVHCSDGWDRTPQIVALAELLLDPYYRTLEGFRVLIEREWLAFGHKFADRCGHSSGSEDQNERCPIFLQWLDCVHQMVTQFPCEFEFGQTYLVKLAVHIYSNLYGTFLCNTQKEREKFVMESTFSVFDYLNTPSFRNHLYKPPTEDEVKRIVLWPNFNVRELRMWQEVYVGSMEANFVGADGTYCPCLPACNHRNRNMTKTRSHGDLQRAGESSGTQHRRSSDPSVNNSESNAPVRTPAIPIPQQNNDAVPSTSMNGHQNHTEHRQPDFYPSDLEDVDCNLTDDLIDGLDQADFDEPSSSTLNGNGAVPQVHENGEGSNSKEVNFLGENVIKNETERIKSVLNGLNSVCLSDGDEETAQNGDTNHSNNNNSRNANGNGVAQRRVDDNSEQDSDTAISSRNVVGAFLDVERSVETSTETLVSESNVISCSPREFNGFEKIQSPVGYSEMTDDGCAQNMKFSQGANGHHYGRDQRTRYSSSSFYLNSSNGWDNTLHSLSQQHNPSYQYTLGEDGLIPLRCVVQERLEQIVDEQKRKVDLLEKELHLTRQNLIRQSCHRCNHTDSERQDDNSSVVESVFSASEGQASAGESQRSDLSWVAIEEASLADCQTLWVPDHAVNRCTGCGTEFWLGRRRHHCRKCGKIFCADCSENSTPLPSEQLYNPVRVCTGCYSELRRDCGEIPNQCKHTNTQTTNTNPQIAASSN